MAKLIHKDKTILPNMKVATGVWEISRGLMFSTKKKVKKGICLVMPTDKDVQFGASVTMLFCFQKLEILFINTKFKVVDKRVLKPWLPNYTPKQPCKFVVEATVGSFRDVKIGDKITFEFNKKKKK